MRKQPILPSHAMRECVPVWLAGLLLCIHCSFAEAACTGSEQVQAAASSVAVVEKPIALRRIEPHFFGFSFVWVEFQESLWNDAAGRVEDDAIKWLQAFPGAVYRYPGGTESNYFDWKSAVGPKEQRAPRKAVKWKGPLVTQFGPDEYLAFVKQVNGQAWFVANLFGEYGKEDDPRQLAEAAGQLAAYFRAKGYTGDRILRWELGNELDRGEYLWSADKYLAASKLAAEAIRRADPQARFVAIMEDYDAHWRWRRTSAAAYNRKVAAGLAGLVDDYAQHSYYDGVNVDVPQSVARRVAQICGSIEAGESARAGTKPVAIWVTEHTRQPVKSAKNADWKPNWPQSANLEAALGVADFMIAASQIPEVQGLFVHALHGLNAPWPLFHKSRTDARIHPSAVYWALSVLRQGMESEVLATASHSGNAGGYFGGYDFRASIMADPGRSKWSAWMVNRASGTKVVELRIPFLAGKKARASLQVLADNNLNANNYLDGDRLRPRDLPERVIEFDGSGRTRLELLPHSITAARLHVL